MIAALTVRVLIWHDTFPLATATDAARVNAFDGKLVELIGDKQGPYRYVSGYVESTPIDKSAPTKSSQCIHYEVDGKTKTYVIPTGDGSSTHVNIFENPKGNHLLVIFETLSQ